MQPTYKIHPGIGIARLGNSPDEFYIGPETPAAMPIACDEQGNPLLTPDGKSELRIQKFKDDEGRIKRQAARFQIYIYDDDHPQGRPLKIGDRIEGGGNAGTLVDIQWRVYLANKKSSWYEFQQLDGEHGYSADHPRRNADITDESAREQLIIDPGPRIVNRSTKRHARFDRTGSDVYAPTFPPPLTPNSIDTLGELKTDDLGRLLVLGGHGNSGSCKLDPLGLPRIGSYANNDGWFDDTSDGPVMARLVMFSEEVQRLRFVDVQYPAWVIVAYPRYAPQILDMVTGEDVLNDLAIRVFADRTDLYGKLGTFQDPPHIGPQDTDALIYWRAGRLEWNPDYKPWFFRDVWTILFRPDEFSFLTTALGQSNYPHNQSARGNFDPAKLSIPPVINHRALEACEKECVAKNHSGELFTDRLEPTLVQLDTEADAAVRNAFTAFDKAASALPAAQTGPAQAAYKQWLARVREEFPDYVGGLLFGEFKNDVRAVLSRFSATATRTTAAQPLLLYAKQWQADNAVESIDYTKKKDTLEHDVDAILRQLHAKASAQWKTEHSSADSLFKKWGAAVPKLRQDLHAAIELILIDVFLDRLRAAVAQTLNEYRMGKLLDDCKRQCIEKSTYDIYRPMRQYLVSLLRQPGEENQFSQRGRPNNRTFGLPLMPLLNGDNPISNTVPSKFLRLTDYQLFILRQWAKGLFYNEKMEGWSNPNPFTPYADWVNKTGRDLDRGVLSNMLGGAFCPGGEANWVIRNPAIYLEPYRIKADPACYNFQLTAAQANTGSGVIPDDAYSAYESSSLSQDNDFETGLQPGDLTKYMALPWQADFNECTTQYVDVTFDTWNSIPTDTDQNPLLKREQRIWETLWWPAHRPVQVFEVTSNSGGSPTFTQLDWSRGIPTTNAGDLKMTTAWAQLGFVVLNPYLTPADAEQPTTLPPSYKYINVERNEG